jgi:hypothetical protein
MSLLAPTDLIGAWEQARGLHQVDQALVLLAVGQPETVHEDLASLSIGERDLRLIALREQVFGPRLNCLADCPRCAERVEFTCSTAELRTPPASGATALELEIDLTQGGQRVKLEFRMLNSYDLAAAAGCPDPTAARRVLAERALVEPADLELPHAAVDVLAERLAECDPQADVVVSLTCPVCGHVWLVGFDIAAFFWSEVAAQARRLVSEVDTLARTYGWREADILAMSPARRHLYLELVG